MTSKINPLALVVILLFLALALFLLLCQPSKAVIIPVVHTVHIPLVANGWTEDCRSVCPVGVDACIMMCAK